MSRARDSCVILLFLLFFLPRAFGDEPVVTVLADFETESVTARISEVRNTLASDCRLATATIPARSGQNSLHVSIGATRADTTVACSLRFRAATLFEQADRVATYCHLNDGEVELAFRVRDADGRLFETRATRLRAQRRFVRVSAELDAAQLRRIDGSDEGDAKPEWPLQIDGYRITTRRIGRQDVYLDDLQVEHRAPRTRVVRGEFRFDNPTRLYQPASNVNAAVIVENLSRRLRLDLNVRLVWERDDGSVLRREDRRVRLPPSGDDYRAMQTVDFRERVGAPGVYRLVASVRDAGWSSDAAFETSFAVTPSNRALPRGRETFFGLRSNLLREPPADQRLELSVARELGVQLLVLDAPWSRLEPDRGSYQFAALDPVIEALVATDIAACLAIVDPPDWLPPQRDAQDEAQAALIQALNARFGKRVESFQALRFPGDQRAGKEIADALGRKLSHTGRAVTIVPPATPIDRAAAGEFVSTSGDPTAALDAMRSRGFLRDGSAPPRWEHRAFPIDDSGTPADAETIFLAYVDAARSGMGGLVWYDLRDDSDDPRRPQDRIGLLRRDFSPRTTALGFATAVGMLAGLRYAGEVDGAPEAFDSALFLSATRQVAVLIPRLDAELPAVLAPVATVAGEFAAYDFSRQARPMIRSSAPPLAPTSTRPMFIAFQPARATTERVLSLGRPWLRAPRAVSMDRSAECVLTLTAPFDLSRRRSYLRLVLPQDVAVESSLRVTRLDLKEGESKTITARLTRSSDDPLDAFQAEWRLVLEGEPIELPMFVTPRKSIRHTTNDRQLLSPDSLLATMRAVDGDPDESVAIYAGYDADTLRLAAASPENVAPNATLHILIGLPGRSEPLRIDIESAWSQPHLAFPGSAQNAPPPVAVRAARIADREFCIIELDAKAAGRPRWQAGDSLGVAVRIQEPSLSTILPGRRFQYGAGFDRRTDSSALPRVMLAD